MPDLCCEFSPIPLHFSVRSVCGGRVLALSIPKCKVYVPKVGR